MDTVTQTDQQRLAEFRSEHPEWRVYPGEFGAWYAERDDENGSDTHVRLRLAELLDVFSAGTADEPRPGGSLWT
jgi:hypothetical protein